MNVILGNWHDLTDPLPVKVILRDMQRNHQQERDVVILKIQSGHDLLALADSVMDRIPVDIQCPGGAAGVSAAARADGRAAL